MPKLIEMIAVYFFTLDDEGTYFINEPMEWEDTMHTVSKGHYRLQKMLYILNIVCYAKYNRLLFGGGEFVAYRHGPVHYYLDKHIRDVYRYYDTESIAKMIDSETRSLCIKVYKYFRSYSDIELEHFVHHDLSWMQAYEQRIIQGANGTSNKMNTMASNWIFYRIALTDVINALEHVDV